LAAKRCALVEERLQHLASTHQDQDAASWQSIRNAYQAYLEQGDGEIVNIERISREAATPAERDGNEKTIEFKL
jgi:hypothetical protein